METARMSESIDEQLAKALSGKTVQPFVLKKLNYSWAAEDKPPRADAEFYYLGLKDGLPMLNEFCVHLRKALVDFCLPRSEISTAKRKYDENGDESVFYDLSTRARRLFIRAREETKRSGEGGELILFNLLELHGAPQVVSKMYLKTSTEMPVHGSDGLHLGPGEHPADIVVYFGESKLHADYDNSLADALKSVTELVGNISKFQREIELLTDHIDTSGFSDSFVATLASYLDPYSEQTVSRRDTHACLIGFDFVPYGDIANLPPADSEEAFIKIATNFATEKLENLAKRLKKEKYNKINFLFLFLPVPSVEDFRKMFNAQVLELTDAS